MGTSRSAAELVRKFDRLALDVPRAARSATNAAALMAKDEYEAGLRRSGVNPGVTRMPRKRVGTGNPGPVVRVRYDVRMRDGAPYAFVKVRGPVHWTESGTRPHPVVSVKAGRSRRGRVNLAKGWSAAGDGAGQFARKPERAWLGTPFGPRAWVQHRGAKSRPFWLGVKRRVFQRSPAVYQAAMDRALIRAFGR